ncbi:MAG: aldo/keto reductase [Actinobacteria bacterium]|nr:aldo/keto reductase [Actinomycetota bacterium]
MTSAQPVHASGTFSIGGELEVHRLGFGAMRIVGKGVWGDPPDRATAVQVLRRAVELGVDFVDTADSYGPFVSEDLIREALHPYDHVVVATKAGFTRQGPDRWTVVGDPAYLQQCLEMSLRRLGTDTIDLWQLHRIDDRVPLEDQLGVFADAVQAGKVRYVGLSEVSVEQLEAAQAIVPIATVQNRFNLTDRTSEALLDRATEAGVGFIPWHPVDVGRHAAADGPLAHIAARTGLTPAQLAIAWLLRRSPAMLPIPGTGSVGHLEENCAAAGAEIDDATFAELDALRG